jgi:3-keto-5-aminohexanoate cleavage enzyme
MMEKLIITCAVTGAEVTKEQNPAVPYTVAEICREAEKAHRAGAAVLHLHAREDDGTPTQSKERFALILSELKRRIPEAILQVSTGGAVGMSREERLQVLDLVPEMATLDCGTLNFGGDDIFVNTENDIIHFAKAMQEKGVHYELECFEKGHVDTVLRLARKGLITQPKRFSFVLGVNGGMTGEARDFLFLKDSIPADATYGVAGIGRFEFPLAELAIANGGHIRVGLEDNLFLAKGVLASSNAELVEKVVQMAMAAGREVASPAEARRILKMEAQ